MGKLWAAGGGVWGTLARAPGQVGLAGLSMWLWRPGLEGIWGHCGLLSSLEAGREGLEQT